MWAHGRSTVGGFLIVFAAFFANSRGQNSYNPYFNTYNYNSRPIPQNYTATWCTVSKAEQDKCTAMSRAVDREKQFFDTDYVSLKCQQAFDKEECMDLLDKETAHLTTLDAGEVFVAGRYHSLLPIAQELDAIGLKHQYAVAVLKKDSLPDVNSLRDLRGKKACFAGVGTLAGWVTPVYTLMREGGLEIVDCNNHVKSTTKFFGPSCAVNSLIDRYNPLGDNSDQLCRLCVGEIPSGRCTNADPYAGYEGAFRCLVEAGEIAFLLHTTVHEMTSTNFDFTSVSKDQFELLCRDGSRKPVDSYNDCNWGSVPSRAVVVSSAINLDVRRVYQKFLKKAVEIFNMGNGTSGSGYNPSREGKSDNSVGYGGGRFDSDGRERSDLTSPDNNRPNAWDPNAYNSPARFGNARLDGEGTYNATDPLAVQPLEVFSLFESAPKYGLQHNLMFSDSARGFAPLVEKDQKYSEYLGRAQNAILGVRECTVNRMTLCVTSEPELEKCFKMMIALKAQLLKPELICYKGYSHISCMQAIQNGQADIAILDSSDVYTAGLRFDLIPFIAEVYNLPTPEYYVVAVAKENDPTTDLTYLKNKYTCHTGINTAAGWVYPLAYLLSNGWIRGYGCDAVRAAAEYFTKSCVPGALSLEYNIGVPYDNMCDLCHGVSYRYCRRDATEDYYGYTGALRCLVEGGGDVAFIKHTTVSETTDGKRKETWARNAFTKDFELLCPDGTRKPTTEYERCNLGMVKANAIVTRGGYDGYNDTQITAFTNLFIYAQQFYGRKEVDEFSFSMFYSTPPYSDLIFQDATQQLVIIPPDQREYSKWLGPDFMRARRIVDCNAGASAITYSLVASLTTLLLAVFLG
ncbi:melanotransferrin [Diachasma alloeum]|uniref:melanotransferrin n=1 Tax=Diachasma alloeum TaxID=454923 RepID=UPI00073824B7|nr:melanotransferrin [Diachasma alloeum]